MKILITGAAGLQGSHLLQRLIQDGHTVRGLDNYSRGTFQDEVITRADLRDRYAKEYFFDHYDLVFHLAAEVWGVNVAQKMNWDMMKGNMQIDQNVLDWSQEAGIKKIIYPSTACVYPVEFQMKWNSILYESMAWGLDTRLPQNSINPHPESGYGWAKLMGEVQVQTCPMESVIFRYFNVYGDGENTGAGTHVIPELIRKTLAAEPSGELQVFGSGEQGRSFLHVDDAVEAYVRAIDAPDGTIMNAGDPHPIRIRDLAQHIVDLDGRGVAPVFDVSMPEGVKGRTPDIEIAQRVLGWVPQISLSDGLRRVYAAYKQAAPA